MKIVLFIFAVLCTVAYAQARRGSGFPPRSTGPTFPRPPVSHRFRRELQESVVPEGGQTLDGQDRHDNLAVAYKNLIIDDDRAMLDYLEGATVHRGRVSPQIDELNEHTYGHDMLIGEKAQMGQYLRPSYDAELGGRFRRESLSYEDEQKEFEATD